MKNLLLEEVDYKIKKTDLGTWRSYLYPSGEYFSEFISHKRMFGLPLIHYTRGKSPETGRRVVVKGIIAVGRLAAGVVAIGHASFGLLAIGQLALGLLFGLGQASSGMCAIGQFSLGLYFGIGQFATGVTVIGQFGFGTYVLAQAGIGKYLWTTERADPEAVEYFRQLMQKVSDFIGAR